MKMYQNFQCWHKHFALPVRSSRSFRIRFCLKWFIYLLLADFTFEKYFKQTIGMISNDLKFIFLFQPNNWCTMWPWSAAVCSAARQRSTFQRIRRRPSSPSSLDRPKTPSWRPRSTGPGSTKEELQSWRTATTSGIKSVRCFALQIVDNVYVEYESV